MRHLAAIPENICRYETVEMYLYYDRYCSLDICRQKVISSITVHFIKLCVKNFPTLCRVLTEILNFLGVPQEVQRKRINQ